MPRRKKNVESEAAHDEPLVDTGDAGTQEESKAKGRGKAGTAAKSRRSAASEKKPEAAKVSEPEPIAAKTKPKRTNRKAASVEAPPPDAEVQEPIVEYTAAPDVASADEAVKTLSRKRASKRKREEVDAERGGHIDAESLAMEEDGIAVSFRPRAGAPARTQDLALRPEAQGRAERSGRGLQGRKAATPETKLDEDLGLDLSLTWRPKQGEGAAQVAEPRERRGRGRDREAAPEAREDRKRGRGKREPREEPKPVVRPPEPEPLPQRPVRPVISIPDDAPRVVLRDRIPTLVRNHRVYPPIAFFGSSADASRASTVLDELKMAGEAGVHVHSHLVEFEIDPRNVEGSVAFAAYMLNKSVEADPEAQVIFRVVFIAPAGWQETYPDARYYTADGALAEPSVSDDEFWNVAKGCLASFVRMLRLLENKDHILGLHLERGEWFYGQGWGYDTSNAAKLKFREWARVRYMNDIVALRAAWFDGNVNFNSLSVPEYHYEEGKYDKFMRSSRKERRWVDYHLFLSDAVVERIGDLAYTAKDASEGYFLIGASYGYTFEWSHPASGHLSLGKLLRSPEIDFIAGPPSYATRQPGGAAPFPGPIDSFALNGKLYISEEDFKTSIGGHQEPDDFNPVIKTPQALESVHWRGVGAAVAHASGVCWMDLWGNGWLKTAGIWQRAREVRQTLIRRMAAPLQDPDVAVFIDERSLAYLIDEEAFALLVQNVRESVLRSGLSAAFYLLSDLQHREKFPESKLYVFLNAWDVRPDLRAAIKNRLQKDNKVLFWIYAAGLFDSGRNALERAREITGVALKPQPYHSRPGTTILNRRHPLCEAFPERGVGGNTRMEPSYFAIPEEATVLGEYTQTGLPSFVVKEFNHERDPKAHWKSVFLGEPVVTPALLRALAHMAGAHVWDYQDDVVHVRPPFVTVHCTGAGPRTITLPNKWVAYNVLSEQWLPKDTSSFRFNATDGSTHMFLAGVKEELEQILSGNPEDLLHMAELPPRSEDTVRFDAASFDVPIMKLDEWMEGGDQDEVADDFLFRPKFVDEAEEPAEDRGPRRRKRRGRDRDRGGTEETATARADGEQTSFEDEDLAMNVMFRRRR